MHTGDPPHKQSQPDNRPDDKADQDPVRFYRDTIMRHSVEPVGYRVTIPATHTAEQYNPFCGDRIALSLEVVDDRIRQAAFDGEACAMCLASASLLCAGAPGCTTAELQQRKDWLAQALEPSGTSIDGHAHPALLPLLGVKRFPSRVKCVMLPWLAAADALSTLQPRS